MILLDPAVALELTTLDFEFLKWKSKKDTPIFDEDSSHYSSSGHIFNPKLKYIQNNGDRELFNFALSETL